jgi:CDP-glycerol glycerophosphotransferase (TagB/SpsB family)
MTILQRLRRLDDALQPANVRRVLIDARTPMNFEMVAPIVRAFSADERIQFAGTASDEPHRLCEIYRHAPPTVRRLSARRAALMKWAAYLTSDFTWATLPRGGARVQTFHGVAGKYRFDAPTESMRAWDRLFFINERRLANCIGSGAIDAGSPAVRLIGMPKVDCLVDGSLQRDEVLVAHGLDPSLPTALYAPTWSPSSSLNRLGLPFLEALVQLPLNVIVKLHDRSRDERSVYSGGVDWATRLAPVLNRPNARLAGEPNIAPLLVAADLLITDHSSAGFEFLLLDRPVIRIEIPELIREALIHPDYVALLADASESVRTAEQAVSAVERAIADPRAGSAARRRVATELFYRPGTATIRAARELCDLLEVSAHPSLAVLEGKAESCVQTA